jgi:ATP-dependent DNA helicase RecG
VTADALEQLEGVGPRLAERLQGLGIHDIPDLLFHLPLRYEDRTRLTPIGGLRPGVAAQIEGEIEHSAIVPARGRRAMLVVVLADGTGRITLRFFHFRAHQKQQLSRGTRLRCYGEARPGFRGLEMIHPTYSRILPGQEPPLADRLTPIYPSTEGLGQGTWLRLSEQALARLDQGELPLRELLPDTMLENLKLPTLREALRLIHRPPPEEDVNALMQRDHPAQHRLAMEELLAHNLSMRLLRKRQRARAAIPLRRETELEREFLDALPFELTGAQARVSREIAEDMTGTHPMLRLLHGDVGSGKTVVAALATLRAIGNGVQVAVVAPTEILAEQHHRGFTDWLKPLGLKPAWLTSKVKGRLRDETLASIADDAPVVIGTHALMQEGVTFRRLGLVIVDEQHRFGVGQRMALMGKGDDGEVRPHQLIMTATPIPRTLAMTAYAGLEVSVIDELPKGRKPVRTAVVSADRRETVIERVASACADGRQAYWVCTLIEESDVVEAQAAEEVANELAERLLGLEIGLVHGRMKPADKQRVMDAFKAGQLKLLVATTVIEVGVDVPNASLMIIENAERLGLSQLHQLRGRVGRGSAESSCVLLYSSPIGEMAKQRLDIMRQTTDGFRIAEKDLELRGPGEVLGTRQTGLVQFRVADLARDAHLLDRIPPVAERLIDGHPDQVRALIRRWVGSATRFAEV